MTVEEILSINDIRVPLTKTTKEAILEEMVDILYENKKIQDKEKLLAALFEREKLMSTGVGDGVAIPHAKAEGIQKIIAAFGITAQDVDFNSLDNKPVRLLFLLVGPVEQPKMHLTALSRISRLLHEAQFRQKLLQCQNSEEALNLILEEEQRVYEC
ncbi:PTS sugar transporter subunit IIA [candidate division KSB1 bacterium]|nr:PTS sugar transporter subunit IIA [candidate division KSB1 bacterium]